MLSGNLRVVFALKCDLFVAELTKRIANIERFHVRYLKQFKNTPGRNHIVVRKEIYI